MTQYGTTGYKSPELSGYGEYYKPSVDLGGMDNLQAPSNAGQNANMVSSGLDAASSVAGAGANIPGPQQPFVAGASLALKGAGTIAGIYGKYQERAEAKQKYDAALKQWESAERDRIADKAREEKRKQRQEGYFASEFNQGLQDRLASTYGGYRVGGQ